MLGQLNISGTKLSVAPVLQQESQLRVLKFLWKSRLEWGGREIARQVGLSAPACHDALKKLDARQLVIFRRIGNVHIYKINEDSYLVKHFFAKIFEAEKSIPGEVVRLIRTSLLHAAKADILSIVLFGSMARGKARLDSDMDLLVVVSTKEGLKTLEPGLERLRQALSRRFGTAMSPYAQALSDIRHKYARGLPVIKEMLKDGQCLYGKELKELLS